MGTKGSREARVVLMRVSAMLEDFLLESKGMKAKALVMSDQGKKQNRWSKLFGVSRTNLLNNIVKWRGNELCIQLPKFLPRSSRALPLTQFSGPRPPVERAPYCIEIRVG